MTRFLFWGERFRCGASPPSNPWFIPEKLQDDIEKEGVFLQQGDQGGMWGVEPRSSHAVLFRAQKCDRATSPAVITAYFIDVDSPPIRREKHRSTLVVDALNTAEWGRL